MADLPTTGEVFDLDKALKADVTDLGYAALTGSLGMVPLAGPLASAFLSVAMPAPAQKRVNAVLSVLRDRMEVLEARAVTLDSLKDNEAFVTTVAHVVPAAMATASEDKRKALRNAVLNAAVMGSHDEDQLEMFLRRLEDATSWHLRLLALLDDPEGYVLKRTGRKIGPVNSRAQYLRAAFLERPNVEDLARPVVAELNTWAFVAVSSLAAMGTPSGMAQPCTTQTGKAFLAFITEPGVPSSSDV